MHSVDAQRDGIVRRRERDGCTLPDDFAAGAGINAGQQLDQR
jgi:hypothetical protein